MACGFFIALEGIDGAGTTSQMQPIAQGLRRLGYQVTLTQEPSKGAAGLLARQALQGQFPLSEAGMALLFAADRLHHVATGVLPYLEDGHVVITDRYLMSSFAYQSTALGIDWVQSINSQAPWPNAHLLFRVGCETAKQRRQARGGPVERFDADARQQAVAQGYEDLLDGPHKVANVHIIDAEQSMASVTAQVLDCITALLRAHNMPGPDPIAAGHNACR